MQCRDLLIAELQYRADLASSHLCHFELMYDRAGLSWRAIVHMSHGSRRVHASEIAGDCEGISVKSQNYFALASYRSNCLWCGGHW